MFKCWSELLCDMQHLTKFRCNFGYELTSLVALIVSQTPKVVMSLKNVCATVNASLDLIGNVTKYLLNMSTDVKLYELPCVERGKGPYKSISYTSKGAAGVGYDVIPDFVGIREFLRI